MQGGRYHDQDLCRYQAGPPLKEGMRQGHFLPRIANEEDGRSGTLPSFREESARDLPRRTDPSQRPLARSMKSSRSVRAPTATMLDVHLDGWLRGFGPRGDEKVEADSVEHLLDVLEARYPRLRFKLRDETGQLRRYVRVFVDGDDVSGTTGVTTSLAGARTIDILHSIAGG